MHKYTRAHTHTIPTASCVAANPGCAHRTLMFVDGLSGLFCIQAPTTAAPATDSVECIVRAIHKIAYHNQVGSTRNAPKSGNSIMQRQREANIGQLRLRVSLPPWATHQEPRFVTAKLSAVTAIVRQINCGRAWFQPGRGQSVKSHPRICYMVQTGGRQAKTPTKSTFGHPILHAHSVTRAHTHTQNKQKAKQKKHKKGHHDHQPLVRSLAMDEWLTTRASPLVAAACCSLQSKSQTDIHCWFVCKVPRQT